MVALPGVSKPGNILAQPHYGIKSKSSLNRKIEQKTITAYSKWIDQKFTNQSQSGIFERFYGSVATR